MRDAKYDKAGKRKWDAAAATNQVIRLVRRRAGEARRERAKRRWAEQADEGDVWDDPQRPGKGEEVRKKRRFHHPKDRISSTKVVVVKPRGGAAKPAKQASRSQPWREVYRTYKRRLRVM